MLCWPNHHHCVHTGNVLFKGSTTPACHILPVCTLASTFVHDVGQSTRGVSPFRDKHALLCPRLVCVYLSC